MSNTFKNDKIGAIILGGHIQALGILRILGRMDIPGIIIENSTKCIAKHSKYCKSFFHIKDEKLYDKLLAFGNNDLYKNWVIFPTNDFHVQLLSKNKVELSQHFKVAIDDWSVIEQFYNKSISYKLASKLHIPIPKTYFPESKTSLEKIEISFPCIIKPAIMHSFYKKTKKKVFICADKNELFENYELACTLIPPAEILIQEIIPGDSSNQYSVGMLFLNKTVYSHIVVCRKRQHPIDFGNATTYAETVQVPKLKEYAVKILMHASYNGICEVEFKKDEKDGSYKFLEVNTRTWKWHSIANKAKTPFVPLFFEHLNGEKIYPVDSYKRSSFLHFLTDFVIRLKLMLKGKFNLLGKTKPFEKAIWAKDDKKPWFFEKLYIFHLLKTR